MRITMGMIQQNYKNDLNSSKNLYEKYAARASTTRAFDKPSDDPLNCARSYDVQQNITMNETYQSNIASIEDAQNTADDIIMSMYNSLNTGIKSQLAGINGGTSQSVRDTLADTLLSIRDSLVTSMDSTAAGKYLFAGSASDSVPFTVDGSGNLLYRGINVNTGENTNGASETVTSSAGKKIQINFGKSIGVKLNGYKIKVSANPSASTDSVNISGKNITFSMGTNGGARTPNKGDLQAVLNSGDFLSKLQASSDTNLASITDVSEISISGLPDSKTDKLDLAHPYSDAGTEGITNYVNLKDLANEKVFVDIGLGISKNADGTINDQSAYNTSVPGIALLGYGKNKSGVDENLYSLLGEMASTLKDSSLTGQDLINKFSPLSNSFSDSLNNLYAKHSNLGTDIKSLETTQTYISGLNMNLVKEESTIASVSPFTATTDWSQQTYYYTAALQVGSKLLQPTLLDYMR